MTHSLSSKIDLLCLLKHFYLHSYAKGPFFLFSLFCVQFCSMLSVRRLLAKSKFIFCKHLISFLQKLHLNYLSMRRCCISRIKIVWWDQQRWKIESVQSEDPRASYKLNNIQIVTNDVLLRWWKKQKSSMEKGTEWNITENFNQTNEIRVHVNAMPAQCSHKCQRIQWSPFRTLFTN